MSRVGRDNWLALTLAAVIACSTGGMLVGQAFGEANAWAEYRLEQSRGQGVELGQASDIILEEEQSREPSEYRFNEDADLQYPELPTGCEATALSIVLRMNGVDVSKTEVADAMPKSDGEDFVTCFWGNPYSEHGWACMAPCVVETAKRFTPIEKTVVDLTGTDLTSLPAPCVVWVTMGIEEPMRSQYEQDGYRLLWNPHCVVLVAADEATVSVVDPLVGEVTYPFSRFDAAYKANGEQAVYVADRGYATELR